MKGIPEGDHDQERVSSRIAPEDRIMLWILGAAGIGLLLAVCLTAKWILAAIGMAGSGPGLKMSIILGLGISASVTTLLALVAGDGFFGEFGAVFRAFLLMFILATATILLVF